MRRRDVSRFLFGAGVALACRDATAQSTPAQPTPDQPTPEEPSTPQPYPAQPYPDQPPPAQPYPAQPYPPQPSPPYHPQTAAEALAGVIPTNLSYSPRPHLDIARYGGAPGETPATNS